MEFEHILLMVTIGTPAEAAHLADALLEAHLIACANIVPAVDSHFRWQGAPERETESLVIIKTAASLIDEVVAAVKRLHSYDVPEVIALPIIGGNAEYLRWLGSEVRQDTDSEP